VTTKKIAARQVAVVSSPVGLFSPQLNEFGERAGRRFALFPVPFEGVVRIAGVGIERDGEQLAQKLADEEPTAHDGLRRVLLESVRGAFAQNSTSNSSSMAAGTALRSTMLAWTALASSTPAALKRPPESGAILTRALKLVTSSISA
jgi:hypothetical protein